MPVELLQKHSRQRRRSRGAAEANGVEWLIDNAVAYDALIDAIVHARRSVWISQLAFDADCEAYAADGSATRLLDVLVRAHLERGIDVCILLNESLLLDTATPLRRALANMGASTIRVRGISRFPQLLHAKVLIADDSVAYVMGSPFANGYWDDACHCPSDVRRPKRELGGRPLHDVSVRVTGPAVQELSALFDAWWSGATKAGSRGASHVALQQHTAERDGAHSVRVARTVPGGATEILEAMLDGIARAKRLIYIEHQYLSSRAIVGAIVAALARAPHLEVIALLNQNPDVTAYRGWQNARLRESGLLDHPRVGLFTLWTRGDTPDGRIALNQVFVHSKVIIVDDAWATVGSANVDGVSLHSYGDDFASWLGRRVFRDVRNFDVNLVLTSDEPAVGASISALRSLLWTEHVGAGHRCLAQWRTSAAANATALTDSARAGSARSSGSFVLPYSTASHPLEQLRELTSAPSENLEVRFSPSWLEVHCSPNWIRNMFA